MVRAFWLAGAVLALGMSAASVRGAGQAESPALRRGLELIDVINKADRAAAERFIRENYAPKFLEMPMDAHLGFMAMVRDQTRGLEYQGVQDASPTEATVVARSKLTGDVIGISIQVEDAPPHRISMIGRRPVKHPPDASRAGGEPLSDAQAARQLDAYLKKLAEADVFSGVVLLARGGGADQPLFLNAYGPANRDFDVPNRTDTKFNLGSMNKMFTAVAVAQLAERGKLSFDDPLSRFLPDFPTPEAAKKIKLKHLLTHTSGLGNYFNEKFMDRSRAKLRNIDDMLQLADGEPPAFEPAAKWQYSNTGYLVLGKVIERASGQDYYQYVRQNIFAPAGMTDTDCFELDRVNRNLAVGYHKEFDADGKPLLRNNLFEHVIRGGPAGGGYSTARDLLRFSAALRGHKLLGPEQTRLVLSPKPELNSPDYGYGFQTDRDAGTVGHSGGFPGISSQLAFSPESGDAVVVLGNLSGAAQLVMPKIRQLTPRAASTRPAAPQAESAAPSRR